MLKEWYIERLKEEIDYWKTRNCNLPCIRKKIRSLLKELNSILCGEKEVDFTNNNVTLSHVDIEYKLVKMSSLKEIKERITS